MRRWLLLFLPYLALGCGAVKETSFLQDSDFFSDSWAYRKTITIANSAGSTLSGYQHQVLLTAAQADFWSHIEADGASIRFADSDKNTLVDFWVESFDYSTQSARIWVEVPSVSASDYLIYLYYGNASATSASSGANTFEFFEDFSGSSLDAAVWTATGAASVSGGAVTVTTGAVVTQNAIVADVTNHVFEAKVQWNDLTNGYAGMSVADVIATSGSNAGSNAVAYLMTQSGTSTLSCWAGDGTIATYNLASSTALTTLSTATDYIIAHQFFRNEPY